MTGTTSRWPHASASRFGRESTVQGQGHNRRQLSIRGPICWLSVRRQVTPPHPVPDVPMRKGTVLLAIAHTWTRHSGKACGSRGTGWRPATGYETPFHESLGLVGRARNLGASRPNRGPMLKIEHGVRKENVSLGRQPRQRLEERLEFGRRLHQNSVLCRVQAPTSRRFHPVNTQYTSGAAVGRGIGFKKPGRDAEIHRSRLAAVLD